MLSSKAMTQMKKIGVCFVSPKAYPLFNADIQAVFGGAEVDIYMLATELAKDTDFEVTCIVADYGQPDKEFRENVRLLKSLDFAQNPFTGARKIWQALKQADADIYMLKTASPGVPLIDYFCRKYCKLFMYKTASEYECNGTYLKTHPILGRLFIHSLRHAERVIVQNQQDHDNLLKLFHIESLIIPNGHRISQVSPAEKDCILWVGRSAAVKGPLRFINLAKAVPIEKFMMICQHATGDTQYDTLKAEAAKVENLVFIERVPFTDVDRYFERAKVFVNTSDAEGFANTFIQAGKAATAILSYSVNPDGFLDEAQCGIACGGSEAQLAEQLRKILAEHRYIELGANGRQYVKEHLDITVLIDRYKSLFHKITALNKGTESGE
jgi:glycosyltransferase involved in cell wall biosynthesis